MISALFLLALATASQDTAQRSLPPDSTAQARAQSQTLDAVTINGIANRRGYAPTWSRSTTRTLAPLRMVPTSITAFTLPVLRDLGLTTMTRAMEYAPGVTMGQGEGHRDAPTIRGQSTTADFYVDGVRDDVQYFRDMYNVAQLEVIRGANALAFGRGGGGGVINRVTKQPQWLSLADIAVEAGSFGERRTTLDIARPLSQPLAARMNAMYEQGHTFRNNTLLEKFGLAPVLGLRTRRVLVSAGGEFFRDRRGVDRGIPSYQGRPVRTAPSTFFGDAAESRSNVDATSGFAIADLMLSSSLTARTQLRMVDYDKSYQNVYPSGAVRANGVDVPLGAYQSHTDRRNTFWQTDATWRSAPTSVQHTITVGSELGRQISDNRRLTGFFNDTATTYIVPVAAPGARLPVTYRARATDADNRVEATVAAAFVQEQLALGTHVRITGGVRAERVALALDDHRNGDRFARTDVLISPKLGVVVTPRSEAVVLYATRSTSALPSAGDQFSSLNASTQSLSPERFTNHEVGIKWGMYDRLELTSAAYRIDRTNSTAPDPQDITRLVQTGHQRTTGVEVGASGRVMSAWNVVAAGTVQRATYQQRTSGAAKGSSVPLVPHTTLSVWNAFAVGAGGSLGVGVVHQGRRFAAADNQVTLPSFTRVDASAGMELPRALATVGSRPLHVRLQVENLFNRQYFATSHGNNNILPGAPRLVRLTIAVHP